MNFDSGRKNGKNVYYYNHKNVNIKIVKIIIVDFFLT